MSIEYVDIRVCPLCGQSHRYKLEVERSLVVHMAMSNLTKIGERNPLSDFTRFFTCPKKGEEFQATFPLRELSPSQIINVKVVGSADGK